MWRQNPVIQGLRGKAGQSGVERDPELRRETHVKQSKVTQSNNTTERKQAAKNYFT